MKVVIFGPPGTGKTTTLVVEIICQLLNDGVKPEQIAFLAYTKAAIIEALEVVERETGKSSKLFTNFRTLHSLCWHLLGLSKGTDELQARHLRKFNARYGYDLSADSSTAPEGFQELSVRNRTDQLRRAYEWCRAALKPYRYCHPGLLHGFTVHDVAQFADRFEQYKFCDAVEEQAVLDVDGKPMKNPDGTKRTELVNVAPVYDFGDVLQRADDLRCPLPAEVQYLIIDEAQDLSPLQIQILERWIPLADDVWVAGDDDQSIYGFQAASPAWLASMFTDPAWACRTLTRSHRCPEPVRLAAQEIIGRCSKRVPKEYVGRDGDGSYTTGVKRETALEAIRAEAGDVFLLGRSGRAVGHLANWLFKHDIPYLVERGKDCRDPLSNKKVMRAVEVLCALGRGSAVSRAELDSALELIPSDTKDRPFGWLPRGAKKLVGGFSRELVEAKDFASLKIGGLVKQCVSDPWLPLAPKGDGTLLAWLRIQWEANNGSWPKPRVIAMTWHRSKGRGAHLVVIDPGLPRPALGALLSSDLNARDEEHRCAYVAVTRTKRDCLVLEPFSGAPGSYPFPRGTP